MTEVRMRRTRDPEATRETILETARTQLAKGSSEGVSLQQWRIWPVLSCGRPRRGRMPRMMKIARGLVHRFAQETLRLSMYSSLRSERFPEIAERFGNGITWRTQYAPLNLSL
jgi:hypothetical protein